MGVYDGVIEMSVTKQNYYKALARARRHYNLTVDDFIIVDHSALLLASSAYMAPYMTIAVNEATYTRLKTYALEDCTVDKHIRLFDDVLCRRQQVADIDNKRINGSYWTLTRPYLREWTEARLRDVKITRDQQVQYMRELNLLSEVVLPPATNNRDKAIERIKSIALYLGVHLDEMFLMDQTIQCVVDNVAPDNGRLLLGVASSSFLRAQKENNIPKSTEFTTNGRTFVGYEVEENVYLTSLPASTIKAVLGAEGPHTVKSTKMTYLAYQHLTRD